MIDKSEFEQLYYDIVSLQTGRATLAQRREQFEAENKMLHEGIDILENRIAESKDRIRVEALAEYKRTGKKKLPHGLGVRVGKSLQYDKADALHWARSSGLALVLDIKAFEKIAAVTDLDFVAATEEVTVTFPTDLGKLLEE